MSWEATLLDTEGVEVGMASINAVAQGLEISVTLSGIPDGRHGFHIHENGECTAPDFTSAGGHFNPTGAQHGMESATGPHAGDMPNVIVEGGTGSLTFVNPYLSGSGFPGPNGASVVIHAGPDDYSTDPAGDSGARIACGVVGMG